MQLTYSQTTGKMTDAEGVVVAVGWAGHGEGKNNPAWQHVRNVGPLPQGLYRVDPWEDQHPGLGPMVAHLTMVDGESYGRDGFYIHGPAQDPAKYGEESHGCIVIPRVHRLVVKGLLPAYIEVVP